MRCLVLRGRALFETLTLLHTLTRYYVLWTILKMLNRSDDNYDLCLYRLTYDHSLILFFYNKYYIIIMI